MSDNKEGWGEKLTLEEKSKCMELVMKWGEMFTDEDIIPVAIVGYNKNNKVEVLSVGVETPQLMKMFSDALMLISHDNSDDFKVEFRTGNDNKG